MKEKVKISKDKRTVEAISGHGLNYVIRPRMQGFIYDTALLPVSDAEKMSETFTRHESEIIRMRTFRYGSWCSLFYIYEGNTTP